MEFQKGQGAQVNPKNRFTVRETEQDNEYLEHLYKEGDLQEEKTSFIEVFPKTIVNKVTSPDVGLEYSMNPYQGCEHGCIYCYARNSHEYWGYSAGIDFERKILVKKNAAVLLEQCISQAKWKAVPVVMSGNTDCYQPAERNFGLTRQCLEVFWKYRHPVAMITKNALIQRDLDLLRQLAAEGLVHVVLSITTLDEAVRRKMEPRTASIAKRIETIKVLTEAGVPVSVNMAPLVPGLTTHEIFPLLKKVSEAGAVNAHFTMVRLNGQIAEVFSDWVRRTFPDRADKIIHQVEAVHQGSLKDSRFGTRMRGDGKVAENIHQTFALARRKFFSERKGVGLNCDLHAQYKTGQLSLFH